MPFLRDLFFAPTLFHEIGHHIHKTARPEFREREDVAEDWEGKLSRRYFWRRYWYLMPIIYPVALAVKLVNRLWGKRTKTP